MLSQQLRTVNNVVTPLQPPEYIIYYMNINKTTIDNYKKINANGLLLLYE